MLDVADLEVIYGRVVRAVDGVSFAVVSGVTTALLGANGAGKTSVLRALTGMLPSEGGRIVDGRVLVGGCDMTHATSETIARHGVAHVPQGRRVFARMTVEENLLVGGHRRRRAEVAGDLDGLLERLEPIARRRTQLAGLLSGGEQQLLAVGRALMGDPGVLLLDEPTLGLAPMVARDIMATVAALAADRGIAVLIVEQNARLALRHADQALVMDRGTIVRSGPAAELDADPALSSLYLGGAPDDVDLEVRA